MATGRTELACVYSLFDMPKSDIRPDITLACDECKRRNYHTVKNKVNDRERISLRKYCRWCRRHTTHRETR